MKKSSELEYREALGKCIKRYIDMNRMYQDSRGWSLDKFMYLFVENLDTYPVTKLSRWLGYIQGVLIERGRTTVEIERDWTRPLFRPLEFGEEK